MINKKNLMTKIAGISYFQITLLIFASFAFSYLLYSGTQGVDAAVTPKYCCEKAKTGAICAEVSSPSECDGRSSPTECKDTSYCSLGCCISQETGKCDVNVPRANCSISDFKESADCNVAECNKGCCILGDNAKWLTEKNCNYESSFRGMSFNFSKNIKSEPLCIFGVSKDKKGACILESNSTRACKFITLAECNIRTKVKTTTNPNFYEGLFCSNPSLNTSCKAQDHKSCLDEKEDVYWIDSCGNEEAVASDCNLFKGTYCKKSNIGGDPKCESVNCIVDGKTRKNGEAWCEYDGTIGNGVDSVGSRHVKHICFMGDEKIEPCADYRNEICVQKDTITASGDYFSQAACKVNKWRDCYSFNNLEDDEMIKKCEAETDCFVNDVNIDENFHFKACVPKYPPGFSFQTPTAEQVQSGEKTKSETACSIATQTCTETWKWCLIGGWKCIDNCNCHEQVFTTKMNEFCASLGDCGAWVNYNGIFTEGGYSLKAEKEWPPGIQGEIDNIKKYAQKNPGQQPADPGEASLDTQNIESLITISGYEGVLAGVPGALGSALLAKILSTPNGDASSASSQVSPGAINYAQYSSGSFANIAKGIRQSDAEVPNAMIGAAIGGAIGFGIGYLLQLSTMWSLVIGAVVALIIFLFMYCKIKKFNVTFQCNQWERPTNQDCNACNKIDVPCTQYRCESLGQTCNLVNEGTTEQMCIDKCKGSQSIPNIKPWNGINGKLPAEGYVYKTIENGYEIAKPNGSCIDPYTMVDFGISLVEENDPNAECKFSQCKIGKDASKPYEEMDNYFGDRSSFLPYHKANIFFPSPESLRHQYNLSDAKIKELSTQEFYVKCKSATGQINTQPYKIKTCINLGPDLTPPVIRATIPEKDSYIPYGKDKIDLQVFINEPSNCKWSNISKGYNEMENQMSCDTDLLNYTDYGWKCTTTLKNFNETAYIKCMDISDNNNTMSESYEYTLKVSSNPLIIKDMRPLAGEQITSGSEPVEVNLRLETSGGAQGGTSSCFWKGNGFEDMFTETNSNFHSYLWKYALKGDYNIAFSCKDVAGNIAENSSSFRILIDDTGPILTRIFKRNGLQVITNENAECRYSFNRSTLFENATLMSGMEKEHSCEWKPVLYYVQCKDKYQTKGGIIQVKGYNL